MNTPVDTYGKDHWSLLAYVETCCVDGRDGVGMLDRARMRCNPKRHGALASMHACGMAWNTDCSTRLAGFFEYAERDDAEKAIAAGKMLRDHDDWDCLEDLEAAGFVQVLTQVNGFVRMTAKGCALAAQLRAHKAAGGRFADFRAVTLPCAA